MELVTSADITKLDEAWSKAFCVQYVPDLELIQQDHASLTKSSLFSSAR